MATAYHGSSAFFNTGLHGYRYPHFWKKRRKIVNLFPTNSSPYAKNSKKAMR